MQTKTLWYKTRETQTNLNTHGNKTQVETMRKLGQMHR